LRSFKDGAIVHAVLWNEPDNTHDTSLIRLEGDDKLQGSIVDQKREAHFWILKFLHRIKKHDASLLQFALRYIVAVGGWRCSDLDSSRQASYQYGNCIQECHGCILFTVRVSLPEI